MSPPVTHAVAWTLSSAGQILDSPPTNDAKRKAEPHAIPWKTYLANCWAMPDGGQGKSKAALSAADLPTSSAPDLPLPKRQCRDKCAR